MCPWPPQHRGDFLTMPFSGSSSAYWGGYKYYGAPPKKRQAYRQAHHDRGYTRIYFDLFGDWGPKENFFEQPTLLLPFLEECVADGLGPVLWLGPEDDQDAQQQYGKHGWGEYLKVLKQFVPVVDDAVADYILGVEVEEYWTDQDVAKIGAALRGLTTKHKPIWVHRKTGQHGAWSWWKQQKWATGLAFQHEKRDMKRPGFLAHPDDVAADTALYAGRLKTHGGGKLFLSSEYAYERPEAKAKLCGAAALNAGAHGFCNGGPGI